MSTVLSSERLILRTPRRSDLDALAAIMGDPEVMRYIGDGSLMDSAAVAERIARFIAYEEERGHTMWVVEHRETSELMGECGLVPIRRSGHSDVGPQVELGYRLGRFHWGKGYATEAARVALTHGFEHDKLDRIIAVTDRRNRASQRVLEKCGLVRLGPTQAYYDRETVLYEARRASPGTAAS